MVEYFSRDNDEVGYIPNHNPVVKMYKRSGGFALQEPIEDIHSHISNQAELLQKNQEK